MLNRRSVLATGALAAIPLAAPVGALAQNRKDAVVLAMTLEPPGLDPTAGAASLPMGPVLAQPAAVPPSVAATPAAQLRALFEDRQIAPFAYDVEPEMVFDWLPYDVLRLPADCLRRCRAHIQGQLNGDDPRLEARTWQLIYLAWLAANGHVRGCPDGLHWEVSEQFVFGDGPFDNLPLGELLDDYGLWNLAPWLRDNGRFL